jgi:hypothetical protein
MRTRGIAGIGNEPITEPQRIAVIARNRRDRKYETLPLIDADSTDHIENLIVEMTPFVTPSPAFSVSLCLSGRFVFRR